MTATITRPPLLTAALAAADRGWSVFPLVPGAKRPAVRSWEQRATTNVDRITRCWSTGAYGVGIACGPSGLVVVDLDQPKPGFEWPAAWLLAGVVDGADVFTTVCERAGQAVPLDTYTTGTASGGTHLYYQAPDGADLRNTSGDKGQGLGPLVDTRANGGYVVAAGTTLADSSTYTTVYDRDPAPLPGWLVTAMTPAPLPPPPPPVRIEGDRVARFLATAVQGSVDHIAAAGEAGDGRKHAVFYAAITLGRLVAGGSLAETDAHDALWSAGLAAGVKACDVRSSIRSGFRYGAQRPRTITTGVPA
ncbi:bifunctional DNA primase/polymerase [Phytomonospora sp. NPDC050363]|uniref:bifunctional DNA primase/polymerase n=1 Tax=Phytomonospora sp. NPDC050363 TaxID=3155642 RepID=UPI0033E3AA25